MYNIVGLFFSGEDAQKSHVFDLNNRNDLFIIHFVFNCQLAVKYVQSPTVSIYQYEY